MKTFPVVRANLSNEHIMAMLFGVLVMFQIPYWAESLLHLLSFLGALVIALILDIISTFKIESAIKCGVSTSVTVGIIYVLFPNIPFWGSVMGVIVSILIGKQVWGGMGKNIFNPAMIGVLILSITFPTSRGLFMYNNVTLIAMILSLPFVLMRPFPSISLMGGMLISMIFNGSLSFHEIIASGVVFWGCIVISDPVTTTYKPLVGALGGAVIGTLSGIFQLYFSVGAMALLILFWNFISHIFEIKKFYGYRGKIKPTRIKIVYTDNSQRNKRTVRKQKNQSSIASSRNFSINHILKKIEKNQVLGLGGAGFPTYLKIKAAMESDEKNKTFIINAVECDPGLVHDRWILREFLEEIEAGARVISACLERCKIVIATKKSVEVNDVKDIEIVKVSEKYPMGAEKELIRSVLGIQFPHEVIPSKRGVLVLNVQTVLSVYEAVYLDKKAQSKYITIADLIKKEATVSKVDLGAKILDIVKETSVGKGSIFIGGGLMQGRLATEDDKVEKTTNLIAVGEMPHYKNGRCSKCGVCSIRCPSGLEVYKISNLIEEGKFEEIRIYNPERCISCGICSYYCLAGRNLSSKVASARAYVTSQQYNQ